MANRKRTKGQTTQWPKEKEQKDKQRSTEHYTENEHERTPLKTDIISYSMEKTKYSPVLIYTAVEVLCSRVFKYYISSSFNF